MKIQTGYGTISLTVLIAIYSISMVTSLPGLAISPILGELETIFKGASELQLQLLESLPSFIIIPFVLLTGRLSIHTNKKRILVIGLSIFFVSSLVYLFAKTIGLLLFISAIIGVGAGMIIPLSTGLIADYFTGSQRTKQLGLVSSITNITLVLATLLAGFLAGINWHLPFLVYCFSGISLFFAFFLKNKTDQQTNTTTPKSSSQTSHPKFRYPIEQMIFYYFITFLVLTVPFNLSIYMQNLHVGSADSAGTLISVFFLSMTLPGLFINQIISWFRKYTNFTSLLLIALGMLLFVVTDAITGLTAGVILTGLGYGIMQPIIYDTTAASVPPVHATFALALVMSMNYIAIVTYPFILEGLQNLFSATHSSYFPFILNMILGIVFTIVTWFRRNIQTLSR